VNDDLIVLGIDEAGRGPWAGPLVAAAVAFSDRAIIEGLVDSKTISFKKRSALAELIKINALSIGIGWASSVYIDEFGLTKATEFAMQTAVDQINCDFNLAIIDGHIDYIRGEKFRCEIKADQNYRQVSAASIIAKVARDQYMLSLSERYSQYSFDRHFGYGTKAHVEALDSHGLSPEHRLSFKPVHKFHVNKTRKTS
jgi:ribonuclease HII